MSVQQIYETSRNYKLDGQITDTPSGYKQTEVGLIPFDWNIVSLGDCLIHIGSGKTNTKSHGEYPLYGSTGLIGSCEKAEYSGEALLVARVGANAGRLNFVSGEYGVSDNTILVRIKQENELNYFKYWLIRKNLNTLVFGSGQPLITGTQLKALCLPLPQKQEQTAIANALSDVDALIQELEKLIAKKQAIKTATMQQLLTGRTRLPQFAHHPDGRKKGYKPSELGEIPEDWEVKPLLEIATLIHGKAHEPYVHELGNFIVVNSKFVSTSGEIRKFCTKNECVAKKGDVLMVLSDLPNGKALAKCYLTEQDDIYAVNQRVCIFRTNTFNPKYLYLILNRNKYFLGLDDGVTQTHILNGDISNCLLVVPGNELERSSIAGMITDIESEIQSLVHRLNKTRQIKQGMMQELLTGKTRLVKPAELA